MGDGGWGRGKGEGGRGKGEGGRGRKGKETIPVKPPLVSCFAVPKSIILQEGCVEFKSRVFSPTFGLGMSEKSKKIQICKCFRFF
jgi:hypothetical protein